MMKNWRRPEVLLFLMAAAVPLSFETWSALIYNFTTERANFTGREFGILQSLREVPGFLAFAVVLIIPFLREQKIAIVSLVLLGLGTAFTGFFPSVIGLYVTTVIMSLGFHYFETVQTSLALQWSEKKEAPIILGRMIAASSLSRIAALALVWGAFALLHVEYYMVYLVGGGLTILLAIAAVTLFPQYPEKVRQHRHMLLRRRYWLYYLLTFMSGARRQIFVVFAGLLMVQKFGFEAKHIALLLLINAVINTWAAPRIGALIAKIGERRALILEYIGLIGVFAAYGLVDNMWVATGLYIVDHLFFAMAIAIKTYFQKIADPADIASTAGVSFTINHIAAVILPASFGLLWLVSPAYVFLAGSAMAAVSLLLALNVPNRPGPGEEVLIGRRFSGRTMAPAE